MTTEEEFRLFHKFNKLVRRGLAEPLRCHCQAILVPNLHKDQFVLWCTSCDTKTRPGARTFGQVKQAVGKNG